MYDKVLDDRQYVDQKKVDLPEIEPEDDGLGEEPDYELADDQPIEVDNG